jgi:hypothetical protein
MAGGILAPTAGFAADATPYSGGDADQAHVRPTTPALRSLVTRAAEASATFRHELRHPIEAIEDPTVRSSDALFFLSQRIGHRGTSSSRETAAAVDAGNAVRAEIRWSTRSTKPE